ncbi:hypothetical protein THASP1DRAFT_24467 [Thamnocephalis sphaerospora]|uniref:HMG box domain-containing protein n=1 Tax=Thamnocephalis sphaerospora TaxID=78915 RepID=A0A4V1IWF5_9FUNG|nr:hypothetical protein THASP1DRAFT_24467 [Thamnocephalis sphaerospora]|eukprot:RKP07379.1 hypothetical protein THASP1DRAFT_24467 [Thamnocephalis sphaerospora]
MSTTTPDCTKRRRRSTRSLRARPSGSDIEWTRAPEFSALPVAPPLLEIGNLSPAPLPVPASAMLVVPRMTHQSPLGRQEKSPVALPPEATSKKPYFGPNEMAQPNVLRAPGHAPSGFAIYVHEGRSDYAPNGGVNSPGLVLKAAGAKWRQKSAAEKEIYKAKARERSKDHAKIVAEWRASLHPDQIMEENRLRRLSNYLYGDKHQRQQRVIEIDRPRRPPSGFVIFTNQLREKHFHEHKHVVHYLKWASGEWWKLSEEEREHYRNITRQCVADYQKAIRQYQEQRMRYRVEAGLRGELMPYQLK